MTRTAAQIGQASDDPLEGVSLLVAEADGELFTFVTGFRHSGSWWTLEGAAREAPAGGLARAGVGALAFPSLR